MVVASKFAPPTKTDRSKSRTRPVAQQAGTYQLAALETWRIPETVSPAGQLHLTVGLSYLSEEA